MAAVKLKEEHIVSSVVELAQIKEEPVVSIKEEPEQFPFHTVTVKIEDDEDTSSVLHQRSTEENKVESNGSECGAEAGCSSDPLTQFHSDSEEHADSSDHTDHSEDYSQEQAPSKRSYAMVPLDSCATSHKPFSCPDCGRRFRWKSHLYRHLSVHAGAKPHKCPACQKCFTEKPLLNEHLRTVHLTCPVCETRFPYKMTLNDHLWTHVEEGTLDQLFMKTFSCSDCGEMFRQEADFKRHRLLHTLLRSFKCSVCEKVFKEKEQLQRHTRTHTGEKPFCCSICGKAFNKKYSLKSHMRTHLEKKLFVCSVCEEGFDVRTHFEDHMTTHLGDRPVLVLSSPMPLQIFKVQGGPYAVPICQADLNHSEPNKQ